MASYEDFLDAVKKTALTPSLSTFVIEFEQYLNENGLLPNWRGWLDVVNCGAFYENLLRTQIYVCPTTGGAYSHSRCEYMGMYWWKSVRRVATILGVVDVDPAEGGEAHLLWNNTGAGELSDEDLITLAKEKYIIAYPDRDWVGRVFVLGPLVETDFIKDSRGGMLGSKQYFNVKPLSPISAQDLGNKLSGLAWSTLK